MPRYDATAFDPPAPIAIVSLRRSDGSELVDNVLLLIDTGADITLLPRSAINRLGITPQAGSQYELIGFDGSRSFAYAVELDMLFQSKAFRGRYLLTNDAIGVLGRDILNSLRLLFDGPAQEWSEQKAVP